MAIKIYSFPKDVFEHYHNKIKEWIRAVLPTKTSDLTNDSDYLDQLALSGIIASTFSPSSTYAVGNYVLYNHTLYRCKIAITSAGAWDASKWDAVKTQNIFTGSIPGLVPTATAADASKALKGDGTWGTVSTVNVSYDSVAEQLHLDFKDHSNEVLIGGRWYKTVTIGNQTWLAENLDYKFDVNGSQIPIGNAYINTPMACYYNDNEQSYGIDGTYKCGLLYNYYAVKYLNDNRASLLPNGWHVPTNTEYDTLATAVGGTSTAGTKLKALDGSIISGFPSGWNGTDDYGFKSLPGGVFDNNTSTRFTGINDYVQYWTATSNGDYYSYFVSLSKNSSDLYSYFIDNRYGKYIRLVKDNT